MVDPDVEQAAQPNCTPITGWRFALGNAIASDRVIGIWGALSVVTGVDTTTTTLESVPRRDGQGRPLPPRSLGGATTIELTRAQLDRAPGGTLWIQGGTVDAPVRDPDRFAFGALRCATDNVNGDNVEFIRFPTGRRHVCCFAYYVTPAPTAGRIIIRKRVTDPPGADQRFTFEGNESSPVDNTR